MPKRDETLEKAFHINEDEAESLRKAALELFPSPRLEFPTTFAEFTEQLFARDRNVPAIVADLARRAARLELTEQQISGIRQSMFSKDLGRAGREPVLQALPEWAAAPLWPTRARPCCAHIP